MIRIGPAAARVRVTFKGELIADSRDALVLEEGGYPPVVYLPRRDVKMERLIRTSHTTYCLHKGHATYYTICNGQTVRNAAWSYEQPKDEVAAIRELLAFYPDKVDISSEPGGSPSSW